MCEDDEISFEDVPFFSDVTNLLALYSFLFPEHRKKFQFKIMTPTAGPSTGMEQMIMTTTPDVEVTELTNTGTWVVPNVSAPTAHIRCTV